MKRYCLILIALLFLPTFSHAYDLKAYPFIDPNKIVLLAKDGVVQPASYHQRYRRAEFDADKPFFQWWYFAIKDQKNNRYFAFDYSISDCVSDLTNEGSYVLFAMVDKENGKNFQKIERYPLGNFKVERDFDVTIRNNQDVDFELKVIDDDTYQVRGKMRNPSNVWFADGCDPDLFIEWNLVIHRNYGWYGQQDIQNITKSVGLINWNTYAHDSEVEGYIRVGDTIYTIERNEDFRAYCDMNWGINFPEGKPSIDFPWGWYHVNLPNSDPAKDLSIIAGIGRHNLAKALETGGNSTQLNIPGMGKFADIRLNSSTHIGVRSIIMSPNSVEDVLQPGFVTTNDGLVKIFKIERDNWAIYTDSIGSAKIPLKQKITIETTHYKTVMDFSSEIGDYNRLLFPHENYVFSDFEALGVNVHVVVSYITEETVYQKWDSLHLFPMKVKVYQTLKDFWSDDGGLEYGYNVNE
jgi:hypothetical protein